MALLDILKKAKKKVDDAIPDFNIRQKAEQAVKQVGRTISNVERVSQQAGSQARKQVNRAAPVVTSFVKEAPKQITAGLLRSGAIASDTGVKALQKAEDIATAPLGSAYKQRLQNLRNIQSARENQILQGLKPLEQKKGEGLQNYLKGAYNIALPEIKGVKKATPLQRGAAVADIGLTLLAPGAGTAIKQVGKQGLKQIAKQYGKTALLQGAGGAAGAATMKDATASDIAKGALAGAVFGTGLKGAGDITRVATPAITRQISKAGQKVQTAFEQPKFQPGFASTKPKAGIEPKQFSTIISPYQKQLQENANKDFQASKTFKFKHNVNDKVKFKFGDGSIKNAIITDYYLENGIPQYTVRVPSSNNRRIKLKEQEVINRKQPKTEAPVVKLAKTKAKQVPQRAIEKAETIFGNLQDKKAGRNIPGFTPAPEAKAPQATRIQVGDLKVKSQVQPTENIVVKSKNASVPSLTEADVNQIARNTKRTPQEVIDSYGALSNRISETSKKPVENIQASLTSFIRDPKKWDNQFITPQKVLTSERLDIPEPKVETPVVKLATKKSSEELAREAIGMQDTQKVVREKVFGKEAEIPATRQQKTQFEINQTKRDLAIPEIKSVSKSEAERIKREKVRPEVPEIDIGRTQAEIDKIIREKVFGKEPTLKPTQPAVKLAKPETFEQTITRVASESAESAKKQPISPEIAPVARVSGKEDIKVSPEVKIKTRNEQITEASINVKDENTKAVLINERKKDLDRIEADYKKATGKTYEEFKMEHEAGTYTPGTEKLHKQFDKLSDTNLTIAEKRHNVITPKRENYIYHITEENANRILKEGPRKSVGDILYTPGFSKKRTGALKDYTFGKEADLAHFAESIGPTAPEASALFRTANQIKNTVDKYNQALANNTAKPKRKADVYTIIKNNFPSKSRDATKYSKLKSDWTDYLRSIFNVSFRQGDETFDIRKDFVRPFTNAERDYNNKLFDLKKLSDVELKNLAQGLGIKLSENPNKGEIITRLSVYYKKDYFGPATETFIKNVGKADTSNNPNLVNFINDVADRYISQELRNVNFVEKTLSAVRKQFSLGLIGFNIGNSVQNTLETTKSLAAAGFNNTVGGLKDYFSGKGLELKRKYYGASSITQQFYEKEGFSGLYSKYVNTFSPALYSLQQISENFKDTVLLGALERKGIQKGLTGEKLQDYVEGNFQELAIKMGGAQDIKLFTPGEGGQVLKTIAQFMQYRIKDTVKFGDSLQKALAREGIKDKLFNEDMAFAFNYTVSSLATGFILNQGWALGQRTFGGGTGFVPFDLAKDIIEGRVVGPIGNVAKEAYDLAMAFQMEEGSKRDEKINEAQRKLNNLAISFIVPAYGQYKKTTEYNKARERGYFETTGKDKNVASLVTEDTWGKIRGYLFGGSYDPERQQYFEDVQREKSPNLGKQESAIFKQLKEKGGIEKAKEFFAGIMSKRETDKALKDLEEGVGITKPEGMTDEKWIETQATNEVLLANNMVPDDVLVQYYGRNIEFGKTGSERTKNETKVFNLINTLNNEDNFKKLSDEQRDNIESSLMEKAGITKDTVEYYNKAKNTVVVKYQIALEEIEKNLSENPNFDVFNYLVQGRRKINTQVFASQDVLKMLEQDGIISEDEYKVLDKMNFLYLDGEFKDRSVAVKLKGSGKGGKGGKNSGKKDKVVKLKNPSKSSRKYMTLSSLMAGETRLKDVPKIKANLRLIDLKNQPKPTILQLKRTLPKPVLRLKARQNAGIKPLTTQKIKVKYR